jgi:hypothetical protein
VFAGAHYIDAENRSGVDAFKELQLANDDGSWPALVPSAVNYLPGFSPVLPPEGIGGLFLKKKGTILLNTLHYGPASRDNHRPVAVQPVVRSARAGAAFA